MRRGGDRMKDFDPLVIVFYILGAFVGTGIFFLLEHFVLSRL